MLINEEKRGNQAKQVNKMTKTSRNVEIFRRQALSKQKQKQAHVNKGTGKDRMREC